MIRSGLLAAAILMVAASPSLAQTVGKCPRGGGANQPQPVWVLFDLGSAHVRPADKPAIAEAVKTAKARQVTALCVVGHTDKLGDKALNARLARERSQAVAAELVRAGYPADHVVIAADPEAFGNMSLGSSNASEKDRRVTILFSRSASPQPAISITALPTTLRSIRTRKASAARSIGKRCEMCGRMTPSAASRGSSTA